MTGILLPIPFPFSPNNDDTKPLLDKEEVKHGAQNNEPFPPLKTPSPPKPLLQALVVVFVVVQIVLALANPRLHIVSCFFVKVSLSSLFPVTNDERKRV
jgi:hypothetical protein